MKPRSVRPWATGPAAVIPFPRVPVRCWLVLEIAPTIWRAEIVGEPVEWQWSPIVGGLQGVLAGICAYQPYPPRRGYSGGGVPIFIADPDQWARAVGLEKRPIGGAA